MDPNENMNQGSEPAPIQPAEPNISPETNPNFTPSELPAEPTSEESLDATGEDTPAEQPLEWLESEPTPTSQTTEEESSSQPQPGEAQSQPTVESLPDAASTNNSKAETSKKRLLALIAIVALLAVVGGIIAILMALQQPDTNGENNEPEPEAKNLVEIATHAVFIPKSAGRTEYALFDIVSGERLTDFEYLPSGSFSGGYTVVEKNDQYGVINEKGELTVALGAYDEIAQVSGGVFTATDSDGGKSIILGDGTTIMDAADQNHIIGSARENYFVYKKDDKNYQLYAADGELLKEFESATVPDVRSIRDAGYDNSYELVRYDDTAIVLDSEYYQIKKELEIPAKYRPSVYSEKYDAIGLEGDDSGALYINDSVHEYAEHPCAEVNIYDLSSAGNDLMICIDADDKPILLDENGEQHAEADLSGFMTEENEGISIITAKNYALPVDGGVEIVKDGEKVKTIETPNHVFSTAVFGYKAGRYFIVEKDGNEVVSSTIYGLDGEKLMDVDKRCDSYAFFANDDFGFCLHTNSENEEQEYYTLNAQGEVVDGPYRTGGFLDVETGNYSLIALCKNAYLNCDVFEISGKKLIDGSKEDVSSIVRLDDETVFAIKNSNKTNLYDMTGKVIGSFDGDIEYEQPGVIIEDEHAIYTLEGKLIYDMATAE